MIHFTCIVQRDQAAHRAAERLAMGLRAISERRLDDEEPTITWHVAAPGRMFTGGQPSTSSIVSVAARGPMASAAREELLGAICELWTRESGCSAHEVLVAVTEAPDPQN